MQRRGLHAHIRRNRNRSILILLLYLAMVLAQGTIICIVVLVPMIMWPEHPSADTSVPGETPFRDLFSGYPSWDWFSGYSVSDVLSFLQTHPQDAERLILFVLFMIALHAIHSLSKNWKKAQRVLGRPLSRSEARPLYDMVENLAIQIGLPTPDIRIVKSRAPNAFAFGLSRRASSIILTDGLLRILTPQELEAVLAHEMTHIRYGDTRFMTLAQVCFDTGGLTATLREYSDLKNVALAGIVILLLLFMLPVLYAPDMALLGAVGIALMFLPIPLRSWIASSNEFAADAGALELTHNPLALASALGKIEGAERLPVTNAIIGAMMIAGSSEGAKATHPPLEERIDAILRHGGVRVGEHLQAARGPHAPLMNAVPSMAFGQRGNAPDAASSFGRRPIIDFERINASMTDEDDSEFRDWLTDQSQDTDLEIFPATRSETRLAVIILGMILTVLFYLPLLF